MQNGKFALRIPFFCGYTNIREKAKKMVEYFCHGGSVANIVRLIEGQIPEVNTLRDFADDVALRLEKSGSVAGYIDAKSHAVIMLVEGVTKEKLQECVNQTGCKMQVSERTNGKFHLVVTPKSDYSPIPCRESARRLSHQHAIFYEEAKRNGKEHRRAVPCPACHSEKTKVTEEQVRCLTCDYQGKRLAESYKRCPACGLLENSKAAHCSSCRQNMCETLTATAVGSSVAQTGKATGIFPGACPHCGGTVIGVGDMFKCLSCSENIAPDKLRDVADSNSTDNQDQEQKEYTLVPEAEDKPNEIDQDDPGKIDPDTNTPGNPKLLNENEFVVLVKNDYQKAYQQLIGEGYLAVAAALKILRKHRHGWRESSMADGEPDGEFMVVTDNEEIAHKIHDTLLSHGIDAEIATPEELEKEEKMGYPGYHSPSATFDYENPGGVAPAQESAPLVQSDAFSFVEHLQQVLTVEDVNAELLKNGHGPISRQQLELTRHLYGKRADLAEIMHRTGISEKALNIIIGEPVVG